MNHLLRKNKGHTFKHSGDLGDIIYSLPTVKALGGGVLYLDKNGGRGSLDIPTKLDSTGIRSVKDLLLLQPYIYDVLEWSGQRVDYDLDLFRDHLDVGNLCDCHLAAFNLPVVLKEEKWLEVPGKSISGKSVIFSRSCRYQSNHIFWEKICRTIDLDKVFFVGHRKEHEIFEMAFSTKVDYVDTPTLLDAACLIDGVDEIYCNQNVIHAISQGLHKNIYLEVFRLYPNTIFNRFGVTNV